MNYLLPIEVRPNPPFLPIDDSPVPIFNISSNTTQVLSTPVQKKHKSKESFPVQKPLVNHFPGFKDLNISDKSPLATEFPITEIEYKNLISLKEGDHTIKSRLKDQQLPTEGNIRFVLREDYTPSNPLNKGVNKGFYDRFGNEWKKKSISY